MAAKKPSSLKQQIKEIVEGTQKEATEFAVKLGFKAGSGLRRAVLDEIRWWDSKGYNAVDPDYLLGPHDRLKVSANAPAWPRVRSLTALEIGLDPFACAFDLDEWIALVDRNMNDLRRWAPKAGPRPPADVMAAWSESERISDRISELLRERDLNKRGLLRAAA